MGMQGSLWGWSWDRVLCWDLHKCHGDRGTWGLGWRKELSELDCSWVSHRGQSAALGWLWECRRGGWVAHMGTGAGEHSDLGCPMLCMSGQGVHQDMLGCAGGSWGVGSG